MSKIPTAKLILTGKETYDSECSTVSKYDALEAMIEFAKLHVEKALKEASEKAKMRLEEYGDDWYIDEKSILNAYLLENIK
jgi:hypothetical protein